MELKIKRSTIEKIRKNLKIFDEMEKMKKKYFEENPNTTRMEIATRDKRTGEKIVFVFQKDK